MHPFPPATGDTKTSSEMTVSEGLKLTFELGYIIAIPACVFGFLGAYLDSLLHVPLHLLLIVFLLGALTLSVTMVTKKIRRLTDAAKSKPPGRS